MISESYIKDLLLSMGYIKKNHIYEKFFPSVDCYIKVDLKNRTIIYPEDRGMTISNRTTCNFSACMIIRKLIITRFLSFNIVVQYNSDTMDF